MATRFPILFNRITWALVAIFSVFIGLYPLRYLLSQGKIGLLESKSAELLASQLWNIGFYGHIIFGGIALLIGWLQFNSWLRKKHMNVHRWIGKIYVISVLIGGISGMYIAIYATGGIISQLGFFSLGVVWVLTTILGYQAIKNGNIVKHNQLLIFSFAACFAAVTLRVLLPILIGVFGDFIPAYRAVAWLCWVPNMLVAFLLVKRTNRYNLQS